jgi:hypothetical protein
LFALAPADCQSEAARIMPLELRTQVADQLLRSNRISGDEITFVFDALRAARRGEALPEAPAGAGIPDRGQAFDAPAALSLLLARLPPERRQMLLEVALERSNGTFPVWYENILYGDMLMRVPEDVRTDLLLDADIRSLAAWYSIQDPLWQEQFFAALPGSIQNAVQSALVFESRREQMALARRGRSELAGAVQKTAARGRVNLAAMLL